MSDAIQPAEWLFILFVSILASILNIKILTNERNKRKSKNVQFTTKWLKIFSLLTMICGTLHTLITIISYFPIFCKFSEPLRFALVSNQYAFLGFYQLARIYYCFSENQIHSKNGYPNWLFVIMYTIGIFSAVSSWIFHALTASNSKCGINHKYEFFSKSSSLLFISMDPAIAIGSFTLALIYGIWDALTLILYLIKMYSFRKIKSKDIKVYNRIMLTLKRILILTALYQITAILVIISGIFRSIISSKNASIIIIRCIFKTSFIFGSVIINYSMYLMQQHNDEQYNKFLKILYQTKIYYICCCCKSEIEMVSTKQVKSIEMTPNDKTNNVEHQDDSIWETRDNPIKNTHSLILQPSVATLTMQIK